MRKACEPGCVPDVRQRVAGPPPDARVLQPPAPAVGLPCIHIKASGRADNWIGCARSSAAGSPERRAIPRWEAAMHSLSGLLGGATVGKALQARRGKAADRLEVVGCHVGRETTRVFRAQYQDAKGV